MLAQGKALLQEVEDELLKTKKLKLFIKREDLLHPTVSGNKWRKLKYNLQEAKRLNQDTMLTFGGAYSNHIYATAAAAHEADMDSIGIIRGERVEPLNPTLSFAEEQGMKLHFASRSVYREKHKPWFLNKLRDEYGDFFLIPEGGSNTLAVKGCAEIPKEIEVDYDYLCTPVGTGGTIAGLIVGAEGKGNVLGLSALKGDFLTNDVQELLAQSGVSFDNWTINTDYHFGGYAKIDADLVEFIKKFKQQHGIMLDPIYTGKMLFGIFDLIRKEFFKKGQVIIALHTGGLQGIAGINERYGLSL